MAIVVAFIFNWIGFLLLMCFCHTIASRYGALSGFGLSLAKWTFIVQHSTELASKDNSWLWWLIMTFGKLVLSLICYPFEYEYKKFEVSSNNIFFNLQLEFNIHCIIPTLSSRVLFKIPGIN